MTGRVHGSNCIGDEGRELEGVRQCSPPVVEPRQEVRTTSRLDLRQAPGSSPLSGPCIFKEIQVPAYGGMRLAWSSLRDA